MGSALKSHLLSSYISNICNSELHLFSLSCMCEKSGGGWRVLSWINCDMYLKLKFFINISISQTALLQVPALLSPAVNATLNVPWEFCLNKDCRTKPIIYSCSIGEPQYRVIDYKLLPAFLEQLVSMKLLLKQDGKVLSTGLALFASRVAIFRRQK